MIYFLPPLAGGPGFWSGVCEMLPNTSTLRMDFSDVDETAEVSLGLGALTDAVHAGILASGDREVTVVGVSLGALVALDLTVRHPGLVQRLVLVDGVPTYQQSMRAMWTKRAAIARERGISSLLEPTMGLWFSPHLVANGGAVLDCARQTFLAYDPDRYARHCEVLATVDLRAAAAQVQVPTLVVCGTQDAPPFVEAAHWFGHTIPRASTVWIDGGHHAAAMEFPAEFLTVSSGFLNPGC